MNQYDASKRVHERRRRGEPEQRRTVFLMESVATIEELSPSVNAGSACEVMEIETFHSTIRCCSPGLRPRHNRATRTLAFPCCCCRSNSPAILQQPPPPPPLAHSLPLTHTDPISNKKLKPPEMSPSKAQPPETAVLRVIASDKPVQKERRQPTEP